MKEKIKKGHINTIYSTSFNMTYNMLCYVSISIRICQRRKPGLFFCKARFYGYDGRKVKKSSFREKRRMGVYTRVIRRIEPDASG